jgi:Phage derived protein Gp49-like (DUF891)
VAWGVKATGEYAVWFTALIKDDLASAIQVAPSGRGTAGGGTRARPAAGRPDPGQQAPSPQGTAAGSTGRSEIRVLFAFDPARSALLLTGGDKAGNWQRWYRENIRLAEQLYLEYTEEEE